MARSVVTLTGNWVQIATGPATLSVEEGIGNQFSVNEVGDDAAALRRVASNNTQIVQNEAKPIYAKGAGVKLVVDTEGL